jgi:calcineurin-like phosphoesterase family protein
MSRSFGLRPVVTARDQLTRHFPPGKVQPLPPGAPAEMSAGQLGITDSNPISFFVIGDHGGVMAPGPQNGVSDALQKVSDVRPAFVYSVGDIVYFHGEASQYQPQFYEPYAHLNMPIVGIPGNHDGDVAQDDAGHPTGRQPLDTFLANFCPGVTGRSAWRP